MNYLEEIKSLKLQMVEEIKGLVKDNGGKVDFYLEDENLERTSLRDDSGWCQIGIKKMKYNDEADCFIEDSLSSVELIGNELIVFTDYFEENVSLLSTDDIYKVLETCVQSILNVNVDDKLYGCNYQVAVHWCNNQYILCNQVPYFDQKITDFNQSIDEVFQYYVSDCSDSDVEFLTTHFEGLHFEYSDVLQRWILLVHHYGTSWNYVYCETDLENAKCELGDRIEQVRCFTKKYN